MILLEIIWRLETNIITYQWYYFHFLHHFGSASPLLIAFSLNNRFLFFIIIFLNFLTEYYIYIQLCIYKNIIYLFSFWTKCIFYYNFYIRTKVFITMLQIYLNIIKNIYYSIIIWNFENLKNRKKFSNFWIKIFSPQQFLEIFFIQH